MIRVLRDLRIFKMKSLLTVLTYHVFSTFCLSSLDNSYFNTVNGLNNTFLIIIKRLLIDNNIEVFSFTNNILLDTYSVLNSILSF